MDENYIDDHDEIEDAIYACVQDFLCTLDDLGLIKSADDDEFWDLEELLNDYWLDRLRISYDFKGVPGKS